MNISLNLRLLGSWLLIFVPVVMLIMQQINGVFPFREETADSVVFVFIVMFCVAIGYSMQGGSLQYKALFFVIAFGVMNVIPMFVNTSISTWTLFGFEGLDEAAFGLLMPYWLMGGPIGQYPFVGYQMLCLAIPLSIFVISAIKIALSNRDRQNLITGMIELVIMALILVVFTSAYGYLGLSYVIT